jgi:hypothetical protein
LSGVSKNLTTWRANCTEFAYGKVMFGSRSESTIWYANENAFAEGTDEIQMIARFPRIDSFPQGGRVWELDFDIECGVGHDESGASSDDTNPQLTLRWSDDGAKTWKGGRILPLGRKGQYRTRVRTNGLGSFGQQGRVWEVSISSRVFKALLNCNMLAEPREV